MNEPEGHAGEAWRFHYFVAKCECGWVGEAHEGNDGDQGGKHEALAELKRHQDAYRDDNADPLQRHLDQHA